MATFDDLDDSEAPDVDVQSLGLDPVEPEAEFEERMSEVELRLEKAYYYRMLLKQNPFDSDSPIAEEVWKDISKLLRNRLGELLGMAAPIVAANPFTEEEIVILKAVAGKLKTNAATSAKPKVRKTPGLKRVSVSEVEGPRIGIKAPPEAVGPVIKQQKLAPGTIVAKGKAGAKKVYKKHITETGKEVLMDVTPQVKPTGVLPMPMPTVDMGNAHATMQAAKIAATQDEGLIELVKVKEG